MYIISQILSFETKNIIIDSILSKLKEKLFDFFINFLSNFSKNRYTSFMLNLQNLFFNEIRNIIVSFIESIDKIYRESDERKKKLYINITKDPRTIYTIFGEITFNRTYYKYKEENKYYYFIDDVLGLKKYDTYDPIVKAIAISDAVNNNPNNASYHSSLRVFDILGSISSSVTQISRQSIYRWIRKTNIKEINYEPINNSKTLYVMSDEKWIHRQDKSDSASTKNWIMSKCFVTFTHIKTKGKRNILMGKHIFITTTDKPWKELMDEICKIYDFEKIETINLLSDAGGWILAGKDELKLYSTNNIVVNTCEFHVKQKINRSTTDKDLRKKIYKIIYEDEDKTLFKSTMQEIIDSKPKQSRKEKVTEYMNYILKHWKGIIAMKYCPCKSSMESHISHCIASKFGSRPKAYSKNYIQTYLKLQEASLNGINIMDYYLKSVYADEDFVYNEKEIEFSIFDYSISNLPALYSSGTIAKTLRALI